MGRIIDITGMRFGKLVALEYKGYNRSGIPKWLCRCECGSERTFRRSSLISGKIKSCGCGRREMDTKVIPISQKSPMSEGFVYLIRRGSLTKIGFSKDVLSRFHSISKESDESAHLLCVFRVDNMIKVERFIHRNLKIQQSHGEWYNLTEQQVLDFMILSVELNNVSINSDNLECLSLPCMYNCSEIQLSYSETQSLTFIQEAYHDIADQIISHEKAYREERRYKNKMQYYKYKRLISDERLDELLIELGPIILNATRPGINISVKELSDLLGTKIPCTLQLVERIKTRMYE